MESREFNSSKELEELQSAINTATKLDRELAWYKNAEKDLFKLNAEVGEIKPKITRAEKWQVDRREVLIQRLDSKNSIYNLNWQPVAKVPENNRILNELMENVRENNGKVPEGYDAFPWLDNDNEIFDFAWAPSSILPDNVVSLVEEKAKRSRVSRLLRSKSAGQIDFRLGPIIGGAALLMGVFNGVSSLMSGFTQEEPPIIVTETDKVTKIVYEKPDPENPPHKAIKERYGIDVTSLEGQVEALIAERVYKTVGEDGKFDPHKNGYEYQMVKANDEFSQKRIFRLTMWIKDHNPNLFKVLGGKAWLLTQDSLGRATQLAIPVDPLSVTDAD